MNLAEKLGLVTNVMRLEYEKLYYLQLQEEDIIKFFFLRFKEFSHQLSSSTIDYIY